MKRTPAEERLFYILVKTAGVALTVSAILLPILYWQTHEELDPHSASLTALTVSLSVLSIGTGAALIRSKSRTLYDLVQERYFVLQFYLLSVGVFSRSVANHYNGGNEALSLLGSLTAVLCIFCMPYLRGKAKKAALPRQPA